MNITYRNAPRPHLKTSDIGFAVRDLIGGQHVEVVPDGDDNRFTSWCVEDVDVSDASNPIIRTEDGGLFRVTITRVG